MNNLDYLDSSDSDHEIEQDLNQKENIESQIDPYWFGVTDDDDEEEKRITTTGQEKTSEKIQKACDILGYSIDSNSWYTAYKQYTELIKKYGNDFKRYSQPFVEFLAYLPDLNEILEGKTKDDFEDKRDFSSLKQLIPLLNEARQKYAKEIEQLDKDENQEDSDEDTEESKIPEDSIEYIKNVVMSGKNMKPMVLLNIARVSRQKNNIVLQITALSLASKIILERIRHDDLSSDMNTWYEAFKTAQRCFDLIISTPNISLTENIEKLSEKTALVAGDFSNILINLWQKIFLIIQSVDGTLGDYMPLVSHENRLADFADSILKYYQLKGSNTKKSHVRTCAEVLLSILGPRRQAAHSMLFKRMVMDRCVITESVLDTIKELHRILVSVGDEKTAKCAICYIAYQHGLLGKYREGRDILLRSGIQEYLKTKEEDMTFYPKLSVLLNRAIAQLSLGAFVASNIQQTYDLLGSIWTLRNHHVLIGESVPGRLKKGEGLEYKKFMVAPYHFIPSQQLELAALLSALIIDTTNEAKNPYERSWLQKFFYGSISRRTQLCGKPHNIRDQIPAAYYALKVGNYQEAKEVVSSIPNWDAFPNRDKILDGYLNHLKEAALRIFCYTNRCNFSTFSATQLALKYDMTEEEVRRVMNGIISDNNALVAYWDRDDANLFVDRSNVTRLQYLVLQASDSVSELAPYTERRSREGDGRDGRGGRRIGRGRGRN
ncbi:unnamed protein product [Phytomonas sp. Hart1]|nr:unnamed protein product [Phytomonas sp. Hart1]|eukprot:CCW70114.1 unnamed protein product [Phytomonas sp. isolate Hart1]